MNLVEARGKFPVQVRNTPVRYQISSTVAKVSAVAASLSMLTMLATAVVSGIKGTVALTAGLAAVGTAGSVGILYGIPLLVICLVIGLTYLAATAKAPPSVETWLPTEQEVRELIEDACQALIADERDLQERHKENFVEKAIELRNKIVEKINGVHDISKLIKKWKKEERENYNEWTMFQYLHSYVAHNPSYLYETLTGESVPRIKEPVDGQIPTSKQMGSLVNAIYQCLNSDLRGFLFPQDYIRNKLDQLDEDKLRSLHRRFRAGEGLQIYCEHVINKPLIPNILGCFKESLGLGYDKLLEAKQKLFELDDAILGEFGRALNGNDDALRALYEQHVARRLSPWEQESLKKQQEAAVKQQQEALNQQIYTQLCGSNFGGEPAPLTMDGARRILFWGITEGEADLTTAYTMHKKRLQSNNTWVNEQALKLLDQAYQYLLTDKFKSEAYQMLLGTGYTKGFKLRTQDDARKILGSGIANKARDFKQGYRKLLLALHPDKRAEGIFAQKDNQVVEAAYSIVNEAYEMLGGKSA